MLRPHVSGLVLLFALGGVAHAQNTSQVFGKVTDGSGAVMPGVTVTLSSPALLEPRVAVTSGSSNAGLESVTVTPGITAPEPSVTFPNT